MQRVYVLGKRKHCSSWTATFAKTPEMLTAKSDQGTAISLDLDGLLVGVGRSAVCGPLGVCDLVHHAQIALVAVVGEGVAVALKILQDRVLRLQEVCCRC